MKNPKGRWTIVLVFAGLVAELFSAERAVSEGNLGKADNAVSAAPSAASRKSDESRVSSSPAPDNDGTAASARVRDTISPTTPATNPRPAPPSNVRIKVQTYPPANHASTTPRASAADPASLPTGRSRAPIAAALDAQNFAPSLRVATAASREKVLADVDSRVTAAERALDALETSVPEMGAEGRQQFKVTAADARDKAAAVRKSMAAGRGASNEEWEGARGQIAADYHAYAAALARIDSAMGVTPAAR